MADRKIKILSQEEIDKKIVDAAWYLYNTTGCSLEAFKGMLNEEMVKIRNTKDAIKLSAGKKDVEPIFIVHLGLMEPPQGPADMYSMFTVKGGEVNKQVVVKELVFA